ncbi:MAG: precorrin-6A synthase (deacetylating) [Polyangiales bacterium]
MRKILVIGIGVGHPDHLTVQAIAALRTLDVVLVLDKGEVKADLLALRRLLCERYLSEKTHRVIELTDPVRDPNIADYKTRVEHWHTERVALYEATLQAIGEHEIAGILAWGDPSLYDSTLRLLAQLRTRGRVELELEVIPGITSLSVLTARHQIPLNRIGTSVLITTGRRLAAEGMPANADDVVVMLDGEQAFQRVMPEGIDIYWGAYLGTPHEILRAGKLTDLRDELANVRNQARAKHGWIMDIYLLRKTPAPST